MSAVDQLASLDRRVTDARELLRAAQADAARAPRLVEALRGQLADHDVAVASGRRSPDRAWVDRTEREITSRAARLVTRHHGIAPGSGRQVDVAAEAVVEARAAMLRDVEQERQQFVVAHLEDLREERAADDEAAAARLREALAEVRAASAEYDARRGWWIGALGAGALMDSLDVAGLPLPAGMPWPQAVRAPQPEPRHARTRERPSDGLVEQIEEGRPAGALSSAARPGNAFDDPSNPVMRSPR
jgi:hypothetical protein